MENTIYNIVGRNSNSLGGIENFSRNIYKLFSKRKFIEIYTLSKKEASVGTTKIPQIYIKTFNFSQIKENDIVILNSISFVKWFPLNIFQKCRIVFIDHFYYSKFSSMILKIFIFLYSKKISLIDRALFFPSNKILINKIKNKMFYFPKWVDNNAKVSSNNKIIFYCDTSNKRKKIRKIMNKWDDTFPILDVYGYATEKTIAKIYLLKNMEYKGIIHEDNKKEILKFYKFNLLFSSLEGMPSTIFECLSHGIPTISRLTNMNFEKLILKPFVIDSISQIPAVYKLKFSQKKMKLIQKEYSIEKWMSNLTWALS